MRKIKIAAWNVLGPKGSKNGIMTGADPGSERKIQNLLKEENPDFAFLQEVPPLQCMKNLNRNLFSEQISCIGENYCRGIMVYRAVPAWSVEIVPGRNDSPEAAGYIVRSPDGDELFRFLGIWNRPLEAGGQSDYFNNFVRIVEHFQDFCRAGKNLVIAGDTNLILNAEAYRENEEEQKKCFNRRKDLSEKMEGLGLPQVYPVADNADTLKFEKNGLWYRCDLLFVSDDLRDGLCTGLGRRDIYIDKLGSDHLPILAEFYI